MMNRRKLFSFFAAAPIGAVATLKAAAGQNGIPPPDVAKPLATKYPGRPIGFIVDVVRAPDYVVRRKIYDGQKFVNFDGYEGVAVFNRVLQNFPRRFPLLDITPWLDRKKDRA